MRNILLLAPAFLAACATAPAPATPVHGETPGYRCNDAGSDQYVGQTVSDSLGNQIKQATHAAILRWGPPGVMLTMDFRADRVTVWYGPDKKITKVHCG